MVVALASNFTPGQIVKCVAMDAVGLTKGKYYTVLSVRDGWIQVITDFGVESSYAEGRFRFAGHDIAANVVHRIVPGHAGRSDQERERIILRTLNRCRGNRQVILVAEGDPVLRAATTEQLQELNYIVVQAHDAAQARRQLQIDPTIELLFADMALPGNESGFDLCRQCQADWPDVKILLAAGAPLSRQAADSARVMEWPLIGKPYGLLELASHIMGLLSRTDQPLFLGPYRRQGTEPLFLGPYRRSA